MEQTLEMDGVRLEALCVCLKTGLFLSTDREFFT